MKKFRLLLLDANVVIEIFRQGLWDRIIERCDVHLSRTVIDEAHFFRDANGCRQEIDLGPCISTGGISVFALATSELDPLRQRCDPVYLEKLDPGEAESLAYLLRQTPDCRICSADKIVYRMLGNLKREDQGVSLEEVLDQIGLGRKLARQFTKAYLDEWSRKGFAEGLGGIGMRT